MREAALASLARAVLGTAHLDAGEAPLGPYHLLPHQQEAVQRLRPILREHGGALLADAVGLGKTFVALAVARTYQHVDVVAPAGLVRMWRDATARCDVPSVMQCVSLHSFSFASPHSRHQLPVGRLVIVDEAHHLRNPLTRRYAHLAQYCRAAHVLLLSATPVHNRAADLSHLLALFLGARALTLSHAERLALIVRRDVSVLDQTARPTLKAHAAIPVVAQDSASQREIAHAIAHLPPPVPTRDGTAAGALIALGLLRAWCSSATACLAAVRRRRARAFALGQVLAEARWPTQQELRTWTVTEDAVQLGFTSMLVSEDPASSSLHNLEQARAQLLRHQQALSAIETLIRHVGPALDGARVAALKRILRKHPGLAVIGFSQFAESVRAMGRVMRFEAGVATLTARGGRVAGGPVTRAELLRRVAPHAHGVAPPPAHERIGLLLTTDLLAEGVNLQDAAVVVHLDLPWTPAAIAQREGRIARLGSAHRIVHAYSMALPDHGTRLLRLAERLRHKARAAGVALEPDAPPVRARRLVALPTSVSPTQETLRRWQRAHAPVPEQHNAFVLRHERAGWIAAVDRSLVGGWFAIASPGAARLRAADRVRTRSIRDPRTIGLLVRAADNAEPFAEQHAFPSGRIQTTQASVTDMRTSPYTQAVLAAFQRDARRMARLALVDTVRSPLMRARRQIRHALTAVSLSERVRLSALATEATNAVRTMRGAGDERALEALLDAGARAQPLEHWLRALASLARASTTAAMHHDEHEAQPSTSPAASGLHCDVPWDALLLLLPDRA